MVHGVLTLMTGALERLKFAIKMATKANMNRNFGFDPTPPPTALGIPNSLSAVTAAQDIVTYGLIRLSPLRK